MLSGRTLGLGALILATGLALGYALVAPFVGETPTPGLHHLAHGFIMAVAALWGVRIARRHPKPIPASPMALAGGALLMPAAAFGMVADLGPWLDLHPLAHAAFHVEVMGLGFLTGHLGDRYARGAGPVMAAAMGMVALVAAAGLGRP